jgi:hypothetical protein
MDEAMKRAGYGVSRKRREKSLAVVANVTMSGKKFSLSATSGAK